MPLSEAINDKLAAYVAGRISTADEDALFVAAASDDALFDALVVASTARDVIMEDHGALRKALNVERGLLWPPPFLRWQSIRLDPQTWKDEKTGVCPALTHYT